MSELKRQLWQKICPDTPTDNSPLPMVKTAAESPMQTESCSAEEKDHQETPENLEMKQKLLQLEEVVNASGSKRKSCVRLFSEVAQPSGAILFNI